MDSTKLANVLDDLIETLESFYGNGVRDIAGLKQAVSRLKIRVTDPKNNPRPLTIHIGRLSFDIQGNHKHTLPLGVVDSILTLSIKICFRSNLVSFNDIQEMNVDFELSSVTTDGKSVKSAWHLDYHDVQGNEHFSHPQFHFQFGGKRLRESMCYDNSHFDTGELLLMESPRIMHPPMDPILAVDFVFGNFLGDKYWKALRQKQRFVRIHNESKELFWKPYFEEVSGYFSHPGMRSKAVALNPGF